jgi:hypothetical protein
MVSTQIDLRLTKPAAVDPSLLRDPALAKHIDKSEGYASDVM